MRTTIFLESGDDIVPFDSTSIESSIDTYPPIHDGENDDLFIIVIMTVMMMTMRCLKGTFFGKTRSTPFKCFHFVSSSTWLRKLFTRKDFVSFIKSWELNVDLDVLEDIYQGNSLLTGSNLSKGLSTR